MSGNVNKVILVGRLTKDPELSYTNSGTGVCHLSVATNRWSKGGDGERKEMTDFHNVTVWNSPNRKLADLCGEYLSKGRLIYVEGSLQTRSWEDKNTGQKRYATEVVANDVQFMESKKSAESNESPASAAKRREAPSGNDKEDTSWLDDLDDDFS